MNPHRAASLAWAGALLFFPAAVSAQQTPAQRPPEDGTRLLAAVGLLGSYQTVGMGAWGVGVEGSLNWYGNERALLGAGGFVDVLYIINTPGALHAALGAEVYFGVIGAELGGWFETGSSLHGYTGGAFGGAFFSMGLGYGGIRVLFPFGTEANTQAYPITAMATFGFKIPFYARHGRMPSGDHWNPFRGMTFSTRQGRPLQTEEGALAAPLRTGNTWNFTDKSPPRAATENAQQRQRWTIDASLEHASIAAFSRLSLELLALGAPPALLQATHEAALDEIRHARACFSLAHFFGNSPVEPAPWPELKNTLRTPSRCTIAVEALLDGCLGEGLAARIARYEAACEQDETVREVLQTIAVEEEQHAQLGWKLLAWALQDDTETVVRALWLATASLPPSMLTAHETDVVRAPLEERQRIEVQHRATVLNELLRMLPRALTSDHGEEMGNTAINPFMTPMAN